MATSVAVGSVSTTSWPRSRASGAACAPREMPGAWPR